MMEHTDDVNSDNTYPVMDWWQKDLCEPRGVILHCGSRTESRKEGRVVGQRALQNVTAKFESSIRAVHVGFVMAKVRLLSVSFGVLRSSLTESLQ